MQTMKVHVKFSRSSKLNQGAVLNDYFLYGKHSFHPGL